MSKPIDVFACAYPGDEQPDSGRVLIFVTDEEPECSQHMTFRIDRKNAIQLIYELSRWLWNNE